MTNDTSFAPVVQLSDGDLGALAALDVFGPDLPPGAIDLRTRENRSAATVSAEELFALLSREEPSPDDRMTLRIAATRIYHPDVAGRRALAARTGLDIAVAWSRVPTEKEQVKGWLTCIQKGTEGERDLDLRRGTKWVLNLPRPALVTAHPDLDTEWSVDHPSDSYSTTTTTSTYDNTRAHDEDQRPEQRQQYESDGWSTLHSVSQEERGERPTLSWPPILDPSLDIWSENPSSDSEEDIPALGTTGWTFLGLVITERWGEPDDQGEHHIRTADLQSAFGWSRSAANRFRTRLVNAGLATATRGGLTTHPDLFEVYGPRTERAASRSRFYTRETNEWLTGASDRRMRQSFFASWRDGTDPDLVGLSRNEVWAAWAVRQAETKAFLEASQARFAEDFARHHADDEALELPDDSPDQLQHEPDEEVVPDPDPGVLEILARMTELPLTQPTAPARRTP